MNDFVLDPFNPDHLFLWLQSTLNSAFIILFLLYLGYRLPKKHQDTLAYILGGVSAHAGLFSNASDIGIFCKMLLDGGYYLGTRYFDNDLINYFTSRQNITENSDYALGWDTPSQRGKSSAGDYFSSDSYGHLGFTGTSVWSDPVNDIIVVLLTNRVYPTRNKKDIKKKMYLFRRNFHNEVMKQILGV